jgi:hypothetical protein
MLHAVLWNRYIYCGSGSYFGKVSVPVPVPYPNLFITVFQQQQKICTKSCLFNARAALFPRKLASNFWFDVCYMYVAFWFKSGSGSGIHDPVPVPLRQKLRFLFFNTGCKALGNKKIETRAYFLAYSSLHLPVHSPPHGICNCRKILPHLQTRQYFSTKKGCVFVNCYITLRTFYRQDAQLQ